jgi:hypothetical protein
MKRPQPDMLASRTIEDFIIEMNSGIIDKHKKKKVSTDIYNIYTTVVRLQGRSYIGARGAWPPPPQVPKFFPKFFFFSQKTKLKLKFYPLIFLVLPSQNFFLQFGPSIFISLGPPLLGWDDLYQRT